MLVVTCSDDRYALGAGAMFASVLRFHPQARLALVDLGIGGRNLAALQSIAADAGSGIDVLPLSPDRLRHLSTKGHLSCAAYARLLIPELLPQEGRCLYLDCDMVLTGPIQDLWQTDLAGLPLGAVVAQRPDPAELAYQRMAAATYVNSGLLLMDLDAWRQGGLTGRCLDFAAAHGDEVIYHDQSAINAVLAGAIHLLPETFNTSEDHRRMMWQVPRILHYKSPRKPWMAAVPLGAIWWHFIGPYLAQFDVQTVAAALAVSLQPLPRRRSAMQNLRRALLQRVVMRRCLARLAQAQRLAQRPGPKPQPRPAV